MNRQKKRFISIKTFLILTLLTNIQFASSQTYKFDDILYGTSYYHEYMPYERLEQDVKLMEQAGINFVRLGESTWQLWEPREGEFKFDWMDRVVNRLHRAGMKLIIGTPTYSIPPWLYRKHPEVTLKLEGGNELLYGIRQNVDFTHPTYLFYCERVIKQIVQHYKDHPAVIGYQIDNETHPKGASDRNVYLSFIDYLKKKFKTTDEINKVWGFNYWGRAINDWDELHSPEGFIHPGYRLEWSRYQQKTVMDFLNWQAEIVRQHKRSDQFVMHNFSPTIHNDLDQYEISRFLDYAGENVYHYDQDRSDGLRITLIGDFARSLKRNNYLVPETNCQTIGWDSRWQFPPYDGQLRLNFYAHLGSGANLVAYWHWHSLHYGIEQYWKGILSHDLQPGRIYEEVSRIGHERIKYGKKLVNLNKINKVAILYSIDSDNGLMLQRFDNDLEGVETGPWDPESPYQKILFRFYKALYDLNIETDFVFPDAKNFDKYAVLIVPPLYIATDELLDALTAYVKNGGYLVLNFKSGFCDENSQVRHEVMPGRLRDICGFRYSEFSNMLTRIPLKGDPFNVGDGNYAEQWIEFIIPETAEPVAWYDHLFFGKYPAITKNNYGKGAVTYFGTVVSNAIIKKVLTTILEERKLTGFDQKLPEKIKLKHGMTNSGKSIHFYYNFSSADQEFIYHYAKGTNIFTDTTIEKGQSIPIRAWDVVIVEEK